jgi:histone acetyltransferase
LILFNYALTPRIADFNTMEHKLSHGLYAHIDEFVEDARLVFQNCLIYNPEGSVYAKNAIKMEAFLDEQLALLLPAIT